jgi:hypothetical protein
MSDEPMAAVHQYIDAFNKGDAKSLGASHDRWREATSCGVDK